MPISIQYMEDNGVIFRAQGVVTFDDLKDANEMIYASNKKIKEIAYQLVDLSAIDGIDLTNDELEKLAQQDQLAFEVNPDLRIAIVGAEDLTYGLSRVWEVYACQLGGQRSCEVFRDLEGAMTWVHKNKSV